MNRSRASQELYKPVCKTGKKCRNKSKEHLYKFKHSQTKDYVKVATRRSLRQIDLVEKVNVKNNDELSSVKRGEDSVEESQSGHDKYQLPAGQKKKKPSCKSRSKCLKKDKNHQETYKHALANDNVVLNTKKTSKQRDSAKKVKLNNSVDVSSVGHGKGSKEECLDNKYQLRSGQHYSRPTLESGSKKLL